MLQSQYVDDTHHPVRVGVVQKVLENPNDSAPRLVLSDWLEDKGNPMEMETYQLLREEPGHWQIVSNTLYWVLDEPFSEWTRKYVNDLGPGALEFRTGNFGGLPFKWVGVVVLNPWCFGGNRKHVVVSGRWLVNRRTGGSGVWICSNCFWAIQKLVEAAEMTQAEYEQLLKLLPTLH